jgi:glycosyltransferase involved in cell wall biosynthesis
MPEYPDMTLYYPPLLQMLDYCYQQHFTHIHAATPGPIGLAALAIARILKLPIYGTYHTALPQYVNQLTDDPAMGDIMWKYSIWYYNQMDAVYVPSRSTGEELASKGIPKAKIRFYPRGIDIQRFHPSKRNGFFSNRFHLAGDAVKLLYVGRVSREKNLPLLVDIFKELINKDTGFHLIIVGSGPYLHEMEEALEGYPVTFAGFLEGEDLAQAYASSDIFIFPSTTDTFGNVVLEAQASGLPVIVSDQGGPKENMIHEQTGFVVPADQPEGFIAALNTLIKKPNLWHDMKKNARKYVEDRSFEAAYMSLWDSYRTPGVRGNSEEKAHQAGVEPWWSVHQDSKNMNTQQH